jgi:nucleotide sugar dehydrogenase
MQNKIKISVVGLGYVGLPLAIAFAEKGFNVTGFDLNQSKIDKYLQGIDPTNEVGNDKIKNVKNLKFTSNEKDISESNFIIVAVPTPVLDNKSPDFRPLIGASTIIGRNMKKDSIVVYESTVYPGATEEVCLPILEKESNMKCGIDFKIGYSPERVNPADKVNTLTKIMKITSGIDKESSDIIAEVYGSIIEAGIHKASSIKVAEAAKVIENSQRDINIAFINELAMIFDRIGIDTLEVLEAAGTKWNFLPYRPGLVGGHCIGVDPYYLADKANKLGYHSQVILAGRRINDGMAKFVAEKTIKKLINANIKVKGADILIMGLTFKENCPDLRNSKVNDIILELKEYGVNVHVVDPIAEKVEAKKEYGVDLENLKDIKNMDAIIVAVGHKEYRDMDIKELQQYYKEVYSTTKLPKVLKKLGLQEYYNEVYSKPLLVDVKSIFDKEEAEKEYDYWRL